MWTRVFTSLRPASRLQGDAADLLWVPLSAVITEEDTAVSAQIWKRTKPPKDKRVLMIVTSEPPLPDKLSNLTLDIVIGHWHRGRKIYLPVTVPSGSNTSGYRTGLDVIYWAEIPDFPPGVNLRPLTNLDMYG